MVSMKSVERQLKKINFDYHLWGRSEVRELPHILLEHEEIFEAVNGMYDGGFALLVATNVRLLLVDKKPLNYLTVEDLRFDMINEIDYSHRLIGARISISAGSKNLSFMSTNQQRLRKAIGHVQSCMAENKKQQTDHAEDQKQHLAQINQQLQTYLLAQYQQQEGLRKQLEEVQKGVKSPEELQIPDMKPSPELSDYLFAQSLLQQAKQPTSSATDKPEAAESKDLSETTAVAEIPAHLAIPEKQQEVALTSLPPAPTPEPSPASPQMAELYAEGMKEIFGKAHMTAPPQPAEPKPKAFDVNPLHIAYAKLPLALRNKKFGRPSFHAHSQAEQAPG